MQDASLKCAFKKKKKKRQPHDVPPRFVAGSSVSFSQAAGSRRRRGQRHITAKKIPPGHENTKDNKSFGQSVTPKSRTSAEEQNGGQGGRHGSQM